MGDPTLKEDIARLLALAAEDEGLPSPRNDDNSRTAAFAAEFDDAAREPEPDGLRDRSYEEEKVSSFEQCRPLKIIRVLCLVAVVTVAIMLVHRLPISSVESRSSKRPPSSSISVVNAPIGGTPKGSTGREEARGVQKPPASSASVVNAPIGGATKAPTSTTREHAAHSAHQGEHMESVTRATKRAHSKEAPSPAR